MTLIEKTDIHKTKMLNSMTMEWLETHKKVTSHATNGKDHGAINITSVGQT